MIVYIFEHVPVEVGTYSLYDPWLRVPRRGSVHDCENADTTMRGVSPSLVSMSTYFFVLSYGIFRSNT